MLNTPNWHVPVAISLGAIAGALCRYYLTAWTAQRFGVTFPYGTALINLTGCLGMGFVATLFSQRVMVVPPSVQLLISTGFLGAYTAFSTYALQATLLLKRASATTWSWWGIAAALWYWGGSALLGLLCVALGMHLAHRVLGN